MTVSDVRTAQRTGCTGSEAGSSHPKVRSNSLWKVRRNVSNDWHTLDRVAGEPPGGGFMGDSFGKAFTPWVLFHRPLATVLSST